MAILTFAWLDWLIVSLLLGAILAAGFSARLRDSSILQFLTAGRQLTLFPFVAALVSTWYGGILGIAESATYYGFGTWLLMGVPYYFFGVIYAFTLARRVRAGDQISIPERLATRFGNAPAVTGATLLGLLGLPAAHILMLGTLVQAFTGWSLVASVLVATLAGSLFLLKGGFAADVRVSVVAFVLMYVGFAVIVGTSLVGEAPGSAWQRIEPASLRTWTGGQGPIVILSFFILGAWTLVDPGFHQRVASAARPDLAQRGVLVSVICWLIFDVLSISTALYAMAKLPEVPSNPLLLFPAFAEIVLPTGLKGLFVTGMLGTILSAAVGYALVGGASIGREIVCRARPGLDERRWTRIGIVIACGLGVVIALLIPSVVAIWYAWGGVMVGALLLPVWLAYRSEGSWKPGWILASMIASGGTSLAWLIWGLTHENPYLTVRLPNSIFGYNLGSALAGAEFSLGTLVPGLVLSSAVLICGQIASRKSHGKRRTDS